MIIDTATTIRGKIDENRDNIATIVNKSRDDMDEYLTAIKQLSDAELEIMMTPVLLIHELTTSIDIITGFLK